MFNLENSQINLKPVINAHGSKSIPTDPFTPIIIIVPHAAMGRWLAQQLAIHTGIVAHTQFLTLDNFCWQMLRYWKPHLSQHPLWRQNTLTWQIMQQLPNLINDPAFAPIHHYWMKQPTDLHLFQLSQRIAKVFERYLLFRADWLLNWEQGSEEHWQAQLWRTITANSTFHHLGKILNTWRTHGLPIPIKSLPSQVFIYKIHNLIPIYAEFLDLIQPYLTIQPLDLQLKPTTATSIASHNQKLLHRIHNYIAILNAPNPKTVNTQPKFNPNDLSLQIHSCHSQLREVQVLNDNLLRLFDKWPDLKPHEILIVAPNINEYAPYIEAVFGSADTNRIPYALAHRSAGEASQSLYSAIELLLNLPQSRFEASTILSLFQVPAIQRYFNLDSNGWERIHTWVQESGICWSINAQERANLDLPIEDANTWNFGLKRLFLGVAMAPNTYAIPYCGVLPYTNIEGTEISYLEILQTLFQKLVHWRQRLVPPRALIEWQMTLQELCTDFFALDELEQEALIALNTEFESLAHHVAITNFTGQLSLEIFKHLFKDLWGQMAINYPRLFTGRVTFCALDAIARIPFRVIGLLGMNSNTFPRQHQLSSFDLITQQPRSGDPSQRQEDQELFWDTVLSAKDCLYISYIGNDIQDNSLKTPSTLVSTLLDYVQKNHAVEKYADGKLKVYLPVQHPLQPFSPRAFDPTQPQLHSYARVWLAAAQTATAIEQPRFVATPLSEPEDGLRTLDISDLIQFFDNPAKYFLTHRLGIKISKDRSVADDFEPFDPDALQTYQLRNNMLPLVQHHWDDATLLQRARAEGVLPHGIAGALIFQEILEPVRSLAVSLAQHPTPDLEPLEINLHIDNFKLRGVLNQLTRNGIVEQRVGRLRSKDRLSLWIRHLALCAMQPPGVALNSCFVAKDAQLQLQPVAQPLLWLSDLLALRWQGLRSPLAFFPESSFACYHYGLNSKEFYKQWSDPNSYQLESADRAVCIAFRGVEPIDATFAAMAKRVFAPIEQHSVFME